MSRTVALALALLVAACAAPAPQPPTPTVPLDPYAYPQGPRPAFEPTSPSSTLQRREVDEFLAQGPAWFIRNVDVVPARIGDGFAGFQVVRFFEGDPRFARVDIKPGDVVVRVNDMPIGKPDQFMKAWEDMKVASELTVEYVRGASKRVLRWEIVEPGSLEPRVTTGG